MSDVLSLLGKTYDVSEPETRDAIHIAVIRLEPLTKVFAGQRVGLTEGKADPDAPAKVGIVDPFLSEVFVFPGRKVFIYLFPGSITSLRHVWEHPAFVNPPNQNDIHDHPLVNDSPEVIRLRAIIADYDKNNAEMKAENVRLSEQLETLQEAARAAGTFGTKAEAEEWLQALCDKHGVDCKEVLIDIHRYGCYTERGGTSLQDLNDTEDGKKVYDAVQMIMGEKVDRTGWGPFSCSC